MERVNHVHIVEVGGGSLVGYVHRVLQRQIPNRKCFELGVAGFYAPLVELAQAHCHLAAAGAGGGDNHQRTGGFDIVVASESVVGVYQVDIIGISFDGVMHISCHTHALQSSPE